MVTSSPTRVRCSSRSRRAAMLRVAFLDVAEAEMDVVAVVVEEMPDDPEFFGSVSDYRGPDSVDHRGDWLQRCRMSGLPGGKPSLTI